MVNALVTREAADAADGPSLVEPKLCGDESRIQRHALSPALSRRDAGSLHLLIYLVWQKKQAVAQHAFGYKRKANVPVVG